MRRFIEIAKLNIKQKKVKQGSLICNSAINQDIPEVYFDLRN